jgi:hypothetical protein
MVALEAGMKPIIPPYISGHWGEIEHTAQKMEESYILKYALTQEQQKELHEALPPAFIKQDQHFHYLSGILNRAAKEKNPI